MELNQDFKEFIELLNVHKVEYLVVGGLCGWIPWQTQIHWRYWFLDSDSKENAFNILQALNDFGFESIGLNESDFLKEDLILQLGYEPCRIDILTSITGVGFKECFKRKVVANLDGLIVNFIHLNDLKENKLKTGRGKDLGDIENL